MHETDEMRRKAASHKHWYKFAIGEIEYHIQQQNERLIMLQKILREKTKNEIKYWKTLNREYKKKEEELKNGHFKRRQKQLLKEWPQHYYEDKYVRKNRNRFNSQCNKDGLRQTDIIFCSTNVEYCFKFIHLWFYSLWSDCRNSIQIQVKYRHLKLNFF